MDVTHIKHMAFQRCNKIHTHLKYSSKRALNIAKGSRCSCRAVFQEENTELGLSNPTLHVADPGSGFGYSDSTTLASPAKFPPFPFLRTEPFPGIWFCLKLPGSNRTPCVQFYRRRLQQDALRLSSVSATLCSSWREPGAFLCFFPTIMEVPSPALSLS